MQHSAIIRSEVSEVAFGLYTDVEIRRLSCCKVTSPVAFDALGNTLTGGLYDARMGPISQYGGACKTCDLIYMNCPGHPGHIELCIPVYQPLLFPNMYQLLRAQCANCHKFRLMQSKLRHVLLKLKLLDMGAIEQCENLDSVVQVPVVFDENESETMIAIEKTLSNLENSYIDYLKNKQLGRNNCNLDCAAYSSYAKSLRRDIVDSFLKTAVAVKKCDSCGSFSPPLRKDGYSKIFERPLQKRIRKSMEGLKIKLKSALESLEQRRKEGTNVDDSSASDDENDIDDTQFTESDKYLTPIEVEVRMKLLWENHFDILGMIWNRSLLSYSTDTSVINAWNLFFMRSIHVPPNRFRPPSDMGLIKTEHPQNVNLSKIITINEEISRLLCEGGSAVIDSNLAGKVDLNISNMVSRWIDLQNSVNFYLDSSKSVNPYDADNSGIRQILEKKEGLFRKNMMGKRVNFCCRSVISPDPNIGTNEIGIPVVFAKSLHYSVPVTSWNVQFLRQLVENGPHNYPGANQIETADGKIIKLDRFTLQERSAKAKLLLSTSGMKVHRHLLNGDVLLVNRQPTLHKPGVMGHRARVFKHVKEKTLRMNYANCNSYNADFDGDEMNCHFVQNEIARSEANLVCNTDNQYIVPTSGNPLRGLIQDHVASGVKLTSKNIFLDRSEFQQLLYIAVSGLPGTEISTDKEDMVMPPPTILRPKHLWTGKQVITALLAHMCRPPLPPLNLDGKTRTPATAFGVSQQEHIIVFRFGELLSGVLDKSSIGNSSLGIVHAVYELYGAELAGRILNAFGRVLTYYLQYAGHSCGIEDLVLTSVADRDRSRLLSRTEEAAEIGLMAFLSGQNVQDSLSCRTDALTDDERKECRSKVSKLFAMDSKDGKIKLDGVMQGVVNKSASEVIKVCLPNGLGCPFPRNNFSMMVLTGAKGSSVNQSQISCLLGQQALEGQRVPVMISGKTLPSFAAFDTRARAGGFVADRFLTGVKPQEYYFHCMAGREGLVDTAVKTSRSGYLQRCLIKHLEELKVCYDMTVRDSGGNVIQFLYGEDGLDTISSALLKGSDMQLQFLARNHQALVYKHAIHNDFFTQGLEMESSQKHHKNLVIARELLKESGKSSLDVVFSKNSILLARKRIDSRKPWSRKNMLKKWYIVEVLKVRKSKSISPTLVFYDIQYSDDGSKEKHVPSCMRVVLNDSKLLGATTVVPLFKKGLPDTIMSTLRLDTSIGSISEKLQDKLKSYISTNPDNIISEKTSESSVSAEGLQLLVWIKYMKSLACPGEAVGSVAAQSIGEPSTQMTLNTFHLAGHGGANVTLGIPRLREIIMTASKTLKTPTMLIPLKVGHDLLFAKTLALKLSRVSLRDLIHHEKGIEVCERVAKFAKHADWARVYRIKFYFQDCFKILKMFGIKFADLKDIISKDFVIKLKRIIQLEQRRAKDSEKLAGVSLSTFRAPAGSMNVENRSRKVGDEDQNDINEDENAIAENKNSGKSIETFGVDSDDDEEDEAADANDGDMGTLQLGSKNEVVGYEEDDAEDSDHNNVDSDDSDESDDQPNNSNKSEAIEAISFGGGGIIRVDELKYSVNQSWIEFEVLTPATSRRLLMVQLLEMAAEKTFVKLTKDVKNAYALQCEVNGEDRIAIQTEGVNFEAAWSLSEAIVDMQNISSNDIYRILTTFGVEAARKSIVAEIQGVFAVYGIDVNPRHLSLIADFMTRTGSYVAMNRSGMLECPSPFLQMSFETTCSFLTNAAFNGSIDKLESPSARIVMGSLPRIGTGCFDLIVPLSSS